MYFHSSYSSGWPSNLPPFPYDFRLAITVTMLAMISPVTCGTGDDFSNNLFTDVSPLLALFGEQVTKQFLSDAMGWADHILFAMVPLGIITAIVSAIRCGGPRWLKAIVGRAKESRAMVELELMSSTSADVCELWNGHNIVRVIGNPSIMEIFYTESLSGRDDHGIYLFKEMDRDYDILSAPYRYNFGNQGRESHRLLDQDEMPPNISLNAHGNGISRKEIWAWAFFGIVLQLSLLVFAGLSSRYGGWGSTFHLGDEKKEIVPVWAVVLVCVGTLALMAGMMLCCYIIEKSSGEIFYKINPDKNPNLVWLQRRGPVGDQNFGSYAIFAKAQQKFVKSHRKLQIDNPPPTFRSLVVLATFLSFTGFIVQFVGMRNLHWSFPVTQLGCTILMTAIRAWVRRSLFLEPTAKEIKPGYELDFLARFIGGECGPWSIEMGSQDSDKKTQKNIDDKHQTIVNRVFCIRKRLVILSPWQNHLESIISPLCKAIDSVMKALHQSKDIILEDTPGKSIFTWIFKINTEVSLGSEDHLTVEIPLRIQRRSTGNNLVPSGDWKVDQRDLEALLSLLLEKRATEAKVEPARAPTYRKLSFDSYSPWERQNLKWWTNHRNSPVNSWLRMGPSTTGPDGGIWLPVTDLKISYAQEIFGSFFSQVTKKLIKRIEGPVELRMTGEGGLHAFGLGCDIIDSLAEIVSDSRISTRDESLIEITNLLAFHGKLPEPRLAIPDIYKRLQAEPVDTKSEDIEEFLLHIFKAQIILYLRHEEPDWESAARFLIEELQTPIDGYKVSIRTRLIPMLVRLFRQASNPVGSPGISKLWEEACTKISFSTADASPNLTLRDSGASPPYPSTEPGELSMLHEYLSKPSELRFGTMPKFLEAAVDAGYDSVVDLILSLGTDRMFEKTELQALENSFKKAVSSHNDILIDIFATHLHIFEATRSLRLEEINLEQPVCTLFLGGSSSVKKLLFSINPSFDGKLQRAAGSGFLSVVQLILEGGADINALACVYIKKDDIRGTILCKQTALQAAAEGRHLDVVQLLLDRGANVNAEPGEYHGRTALQAAAGGGHLDVVQLLLDRGANVNAEPAMDNGRTALQAAAGGGHLDVVQLLLDRGANFNAEPANYYGRTALQAAAWGNHRDVVQLLRLAGSRELEPLVWDGEE